MALTIDERKERYYNLVLEKANEIYRSWQTNRIKSKRLVAQANVYAFDSRLKLVAAYRFYVLAFTVALGIRLEKRYSTFFRRLFYLFAYLRERAAFRMLKRVFGFHGDTDIREMIELEAENVIVLLSNQQNQHATGGGKRAEIGEIAVEEKLDAFFEECTQEEQKTAENNLDTDKTEKVDTRAESSPIKVDDTKREKIFVEELGRGEQVGEQKKKANSSTKIEQSEKQTSQTSETDIAKNEKTERTIEKTVANTSILAEMTVLEQDKKEDVPSPFPVFRENQGNRPAVGGKENSALSKENNETKLEREHSENLNKGIRVETEREKSPFPVFDKNKPLEIKTPEKTVEKEVKIVKEVDTVKGNCDLTAITDVKSSDEMTMHALSNISEENKSRGALNITMSKEEIAAIVTQVKTEANMIMEREELAWREKISVAEGVNSTQSSSKIVENTQNSGNIKQNLKK